MLKTTLLFSWRYMPNPCKLILASVVYHTLNISVPFCMAWLINSLVAEMSMSVIMISALCICLAAYISSVSSWGNDCLRTIAQERMQNELRQEAFAALRNMPRLERIKESPATWLQKINADTATAASAAALVMNLVPMSAVYFSVVLWACCSKSVFFLLALLGMLLLAWKIHKNRQLGLTLAAERAREQHYRFASYLLDSIHMLDIERVFRLETSSDKRFCEENQALQKQCTTSGLLGHHYGMANNLAIWSAYSAIFMFSLYLNQRGILKVGDLVAVHLLLLQLIGAVFMVADVLPALEVGRDAITSLRRMFGSEKGDKAVCPSGEPPQTQSLASHTVLELRDISFQYPTQPSPTLHHLSLSISQRERVCILGENGAGKSTLINIALGLISPTKGRVLATAEQMAYIPSDTYLFHGPLLENIRLYDSRISDGVVADTLTRFAHCGGEKRKLPALQSQVGPSDLSDGQRQIIGISRVLVRQPTLIVADEVTKSLDKDARAHIEQLLIEASRDCALLGTSHYLPAAGLYDRYLLLKHGSLKEMTYSEVLEYFAA